MRILGLALVLLLSACVASRYHGKSHKPTKELAIYYSRTELPKGNYQTMGELDVIADTVCSSEAIIKKIREAAMSKGADIAIIHWFDVSFFTEKHKHVKACQTSHCHPEPKDKYKYKKLVKITLIKRKK